MLSDFAQMAAAATWLIASPELPWQWDENCEAVIWRDGTTIVFREELAQILERFEGKTLPPLGAMILLLAACRGKYPGPTDAPGFGKRLEESVLQPLARIAQFPAALSSGVPAKATLINHVLGDCNGASPSVAEVVKLLRSGLPFTEMLEEDSAPDSEPLRRYMAPLARVLRTVDEPTLRLLLSTGLPALPEPQDPATPAPPQTEEIAKFLSDLLSDPELAGIARITRQVMAAIALPRVLTRTEDETLGGVSNIANRGPLHRLLLSELAHDDDTLTVRLAMNEALYYQREPAVSHPPSRLVILIDSGLRMWGLPRLFATSVALAFLGKAHSHVQPAAYRSAEGSYVPATLGTKEGLVGHLSALDAVFEPSEATEGLVKQLAREKAQVDLVVITHSRTLRDERFLEALPASAPISSYAVGVNRDGHVSLCSRTPHGLRQLNEIWIDLKTLFPAASPASSQLRDVSGELPAIFRASPFPFLLQPRSEVEVGWSIIDGGGICLTTGGTLWHWAHPSRGATRLSVPAMKGRTLGLFYSASEKCWVAVKHDTPQQRLEIVRWFGENAAIGTGGGATLTTIEGVTGEARYAFTRGGELYVVFPAHVRVISLTTGLQIGRGNFWERPIGSRFLDHGVRDGKARFAFFYWDGLAVRFSELALPAIQRNNPIVLMFDRAEYESPWAVDESGAIFDTANPGVVALWASGPIVEAKASPSGKRVWMRDASGSFETALLEDRRLQRPGRQFPRCFDGYAEPPRHNVRSKFTHIGISSAGGVMLRAKLGNYVELAAGPDGIFDMRAARDDSILRQVPFSEPKDLPEFGCSLRRAEWPDGSRAFLDSWGLLHLQSYDPKTPEVSFILTASAAMPAWSSDGRMIGPDYFIGDHVPAEDDGQTIASYVNRFTSSLL